MKFCNVILSEKRNAPTRVILSEARNAPTRVILSEARNATPCVILSEARSAKSKNLATFLLPLVILNVVKNPVTFFLAFVLATLSACTDYEADYEDMYGYMLAGGSISYGTLTDIRDNQTYRTITIGTQTWMAENLNYDYNKGTAKSYCYDNETSNCDKYGRLYLWSAAMDSAAVFSTAGKGCGYGKTCSPSGTVRGVCPEGWHLPNDDEWNTLFTAVGGTSIAGTKLKSTSGWYNSGNGTDSFGFAVLPAGFRSNLGDFGNTGSSTYFLSSTEYDSSSAYSWYFYYNREDMYHYRKDDGFSVRCLMDSTDEGGDNSSSSSKTTSSSSAETSSSSSAPTEDPCSSSIAYGTLTDARDNQTYKTVTIGTQTWMAENLNYNYNEGTAKSYCYDNETSNCDKYGRLYLWSAAMDSAAVFSTAGKGCGYGKTCSPSGTVRGVCPEGWHLPNDDEWNALFTAVGGNITAGTKLKSTSGWSSNGNGTDAFGFSALPAGYRNNGGHFYDVGDYAHFWCSSEAKGLSDLAFSWRFYYSYTSVNDYYDGAKYFGFSVRCLRDSE